MSEPPRRPITGPLQALRDAVAPAPAPAAPDAAPAAGPAAAADPAEAAAARARQRLTFIKGYMSDPTQPLFANVALVVRVFEEERVYQHGVAQDLTRAIADRPASLPPAVLRDWQTRLASAQRRQEQMYTLIKRATGAAPRAGGSGVLPAAEAPKPAPPPTLETPVEDVLDALFDD